MKKTLFFSVLLLASNILFAQAWLTSPFNSNNIYNPNFSGLGLVGIGTNNPGYLLDVAGISHAQDFIADAVHPGDIAAYVRGAVNGNANLVLQGGTPSNVAYWFTSGGGLLKIGGNGGSEPAVGALNMDYNGHLGVFTIDTKGYMFAVAGSAIFTQVVVKTQVNWPDYVFHKSYHLPSLDSVAAYIKINNHLPDMPSAEEVTKNGIDLGANQAKLLEKIEQLTLYTIELQKEVDHLKAENDKLSDLQYQINQLKKLSK
jgi:hypothetical protein